MTIKRIDQAWQYKNEVELVSASYMGKKRYNPRIYIPIHTTYEKDWDYAHDLLKTLAQYNHCNMVINVRKEVETWSETSDSGKGTHYYKVARFSGIAVVKS